MNGAHPYRSCKSTIGLPTGQPSGNIFSVEVPLSKMTLACFRLIENYPTHAHTRTHIHMCTYTHMHIYTCPYMPPHTHHAVVFKIIFTIIKLEPSSDSRIASQKLKPSTLHFQPGLLCLAIITRTVLSGTVLHPPASVLDDSPLWEWSTVYVSIRWQTFQEGMRAGYSQGNSSAHLDFGCVILQQGAFKGGGQCDKQMWLVVPSLCRLMFPSCCSSSFQE